MAKAKRVRIAVDAMGGDYAPEEVVSGAVQAARELGVEIILVGPKVEVEQELAKHDITNLLVRVVEATQKIADGEEPVIAVMRKPNSSMALTTRLVKEGQADGAVSAGSTGALSVCAYQYVGMLPGMERPVAGGPFVGLAPRTVVLDLGANVGAEPYSLVNFAVAGIAYAKSFLGVDNPTVGLLNVGAEEGKGDKKAKESFALLKKSGLNFIGNVEGMDIVRGKANVIVCDGFVGNVLVKFCEALGRAVSRWLEHELKGKLTDEELGKVGSKLVRLVSPGEVMGGGPLIGINGVVSVAHGASRAGQIKGTIEITKTAIEKGFVDMLRAELAKAQKAISE